MLVDTDAVAAERSPDRTELVARAAALRERLWEAAAEADRTHRLTDEAVTALTESGLMRLMTPKRLGGHQTDIRTLLEVAVEVGRGCCSAAWVTGVVNAGNFVVSLFPEAAQDEVWGGNPDARTAFVLGRPSNGVEETEGGVLISGQWPYASGSLHAEWMGGLVVDGADAGKPVVQFALMPMDELSVKDTWHFAGMRGTGSNTVVAERVFVPRHRLLPYVPVLNGETDGLIDAGHRYRNSFTGIFCVGLIGSLIGGADAAFRYVQEKASTRPVAGSTYAKQTESPTLQLDLAAAATKIESARLLATALTDRIDRFASAGENPDVVTRARARMDSTQVTQLCREAVDILLTAYGSSAFAESNPLQRIWRDVNVGSRHAGFGMGIPQQVYGRALVGKDPREISLLV
ncbi:acyl-CoA dehydrogenase family protein [Streptomyces flaveus]|uniref:Acyl-CoA dehydrogenase n=1 Tax=Streptomyces flaveus TaxID=66370 RepID=A0A917VGQ3_9ACTN|nr:acyl-CoA dehydrogenase family protein [Streptomyces flaveus]GGK76151.1 acyl-CoA dehydrogenase [Streptomyces flaveus]